MGFCGYGNQHCRWKPGCLRLQPRQWPDHCLYPAQSCQQRIGRSHQRQFGRWSCRWAKRPIVIMDPFSTSVGGGTSKAQDRLSSGWATSRLGRSQQCASGHRQKVAASRQNQLLSTCMKLKKLCINGKFKPASHLSIMEQLRIKADQFRKQGRLQEQDSEEL
jgi:hypothetical protein